MFTGWIALLLPLSLEESRLSLGHATDSTTHSQIPRLESSLAMGLPTRPLAVLQSRPVRSGLIHGIRRQIRGGDEQWVSHSLEESLANASDAAKSSNSS